MKKTNTIALLLSLTLSVAYANLNRDGMRGVGNTHSAQSMGHSFMGVGVQAEINKDAQIFQDRGWTDSPDKMQLTMLRYPKNSMGDSTYQYGTISNYIGMTAYPMVSIGLGNFFDFGVSLPVYYDAPSVNSRNSDGTEAQSFSGLTKSGIGDARVLAKVRLPIPEDASILDMAFLLGAQLPTNNAQRGLWLREIEYFYNVPKNDPTGSYNISNGEVLAFGAGQTPLRFGAAVTLDFYRLLIPKPFQIHANYQYRYSQNPDYPSVNQLSVAVDVRPVPFLTIYGEYYKETPSITPKTAAGVEMALPALSYVQAGGVVHTEIGIDIYLGGKFSLGSDEYLENVQLPARDEPMEYSVFRYNVRTQPKMAGVLGITWAGFLIPQDADGDGVLDKHDRCPDEYGAAKNDGCPWPNPDLDGDGVCDAWVAEKGLQDEMADICSGIDQCPNRVGPDWSNGCPTKDPDLDKDGVCDPWVAQEKLLNEFADVCTGIDKCPNDVGAVEDDGCPLQNPDIDGDGVCDPWVAEKGLFERFAEQCVGIDKCPNEAGEDWNDGCPAQDPDLDKDGVCEPWVSQQKLSEKFADICVGIDKCPADSGTVENEGCPMANPDIDGDGVCDSWVAAKGLLEKFAETCTGIDQCPNRAGPLENEGCPAKPIEKKVTLKGVNFKTGTAELTFEAKQILDPVVEQLLVFEDVKIEIWGHTDDRGNDEFNQKLSERRAQAVVDYFASKGVASSRLKAIGKGEEMPTASNKTAEGRAQNRRIEMYRVE